MSNIVVVGSINMDIITRVSHIPAVGETILAKGFDTCPGGKGANQAIAIKRLGGDVSFIGCIGDDEYGKQIYEGFKSENINVEGIQFLKGSSTGRAYINVADDGNNNIVVYQGANALVTVDYIKENSHVFKDAKYCVLQMEIPLETIEYVIEMCKEKGIKVILNPAPAQQINKKLIEGVYILIPNETEANIISNGEYHNIEECAKSLYSLGAENIIITLGDKGSLLLNSEELNYYDAIRCSAMDTTAAGDTFIGGLVVGLSEGQKFEEAITLATKASGICVSRAGAQASIPLRSEIK